MASKPNPFIKARHSAPPRRHAPPPKGRAPFPGVTPGANPFAPPPGSPAPPFAKGGTPPFAKGGKVAYKKGGKMETLKPTKKGEVPIQFRKGGLHASTGTPAGKPIPAAKAKAAMSGKFGAKAKREALFEKNVLTGKKGK